MGHKYLLVTHTLHRLKTYSKAKTVASAAPAASFLWAIRPYAVNSPTEPWCFPTEIGSGVLLFR
jgi:hypothetical protein